VTFIVMNNREYNVLKNFMRSQEHYTAAKTNRFVAMEIDNHFDGRPGPTNRARRRYRPGYRSRNRIASH
jgi:hypothetical protein